MAQASPRRLALHLSVPAEPPLSAGGLTVPEVKGKACAGQFPCPLTVFYSSGRSPTLHALRTEAHTATERQKQSSLEHCRWALAAWLTGPPLPISDAHVGPGAPRAPWCTGSGDPQGLCQLCFCHCPVAVVSLSCRHPE